MDSWNGKSLKNLFKSCRICSFKQWNQVHLFKPYRVGSNSHLTLHVFKHVAFAQAFILSIFSNVCQVFSCLTRPSDYKLLLRLVGVSKRAKGLCTVAPVQSPADQQPVAWEIGECAFHLNTRVKPSLLAFYLSHVCELEQPRAALVLLELIRNARISRLYRVFKQ